VKIVAAFSAQKGYSMKAAYLAAAVLIATLTPASAVTRETTREYTPPPRAGDIYTVIDFPVAHGTAQAISVDEVMGNRHRDFVAAPRYSCAHAMPAGVVVRFRHFTPDSVPFTLTTTGIILHGPYQGEIPLEALHHCYQLAS
jgi:hypothetical protein